MSMTREEFEHQRAVARWFRDKYPGKYVGFAPLAPGQMPSDTTEVRLGDSAEEAFKELYKEPRMPLVHGNRYYLFPPNEEPDGFIGGSSLMFEDDLTEEARVQRDRGLLSAEELDRLFRPTDGLGPLTDVPKLAQPLTQEDRERLWKEFIGEERKRLESALDPQVYAQVSAELERTQGQDLGDDQGHCGCGRSPCECDSK